MPSPHRLLHLRHPCLSLHHSQVLSTLASHRMVPLTHHLGRPQHSTRNTMPHRRRSQQAEATQARTHIPQIFQRRARQHRDQKAMRGHVGVMKTNGHLVGHTRRTQSLTSLRRCRHGNNTTARRGRSTTMMFVNPAAVIHGDSLFFLSLVYVSAGQAARG